MTNAKTRSIHIENEDGSATLVAGIPDNAKITFGPISPGGKDRYSYENVLRIYRGGTGTNQLAVFRKVLGFIDLSLDIEHTELVIENESTEVHGKNASSRSSSSNARRRVLLPSDGEN